MNYRKKIQYSISNNMKLNLTLQYNAINETTTTTTTKNLNIWSKVH